MRRSITFAIISCKGHGLRGMPGTHRLGKATGQAELQPTIRFLPSVLHWYSLHFRLSVNARLHKTTSMPPLPCS
ncbi:unnamed protein product [Peniophora sp. CBMAI 1063]|nr:unnamed protein product [Peniophora sp. CBMAI 1063]